MQHPGKPKHREQLAGYLTISPALILILALTLYPVAYSIWLSLLEKHSFFPQERFVGLENFFSLWKWLRNDLYGVVNYWMLDLRIIRDPISWLGADHIMLSVIVMSVWQFFPFVLLSILARLQTIPPELYEAAKVDGASASRRFLNITLPQIT